MNATKKLIPLLLCLLLAVGELSTVPLARVSAVSSSTLVISIDGGTLQFPGENATFYFTTTANGNVVNPDNMSVTLYLPNNINSLTLTPIKVTNGVFEVTWAIPANAATGFYSLVVYASYGYGTFGGLAVKGFEISQGIQNNQNQVMTAIGGLSAQLSSVESNILFSLNSTVKAAATPVISASGLLGGFFLPFAPAATSQALGFVLFALIAAAILVSSSLLLRRRSII